MSERRKSKERRKAPRRKLIGEKDFRNLIETGKTGSGDRRNWSERRTTKKRKTQIGI